MESCVCLPSSSYFFQRHAMILFTREPLAFLGWEEEQDGVFSRVFTLAAGL